MTEQPPEANELYEDWWPHRYELLAYTLVVLFFIALLLVAVISL